METLNVQTSANGDLYTIDVKTNKCKKVMRDFSDINIDLGDLSIPLTTYQRHLKDKFEEDAPIKKGKLMFRGYRISFTHEGGFMIEDTNNKYKVVETEFDCVPTPKELVEFFKKPIKQHTSEELVAATELGKALAEARSSKFIEKVKAEEVETVEVDYKKLQKKVLHKISQVKEGVDSKFDPTTFPDMIPFKKWKRKVNAVVKDWKEKRIRYNKLLNLIEEITVTETFEETVKKAPYKFVGTQMPEFEYVGDLVGDKIQVDGELTPAVPFLTNYLLALVPKAMPQLMKFAKGEIDKVSLLRNPIVSDLSVVYEERVLENNIENAELLTALFGSVNYNAPQDLIYGGFEVGERILLFNGVEWKYTKITEVEGGVTVRGGIGLLKTDKWVRA
jgi:hypothetical protein